MTPAWPQKRDRCPSCSRVRPAWLSVAPRPNGALRPGYPGDMHPDPVGPSLTRMGREDIRRRRMTWLKWMSHGPLGGGPRMKTPKRPTPRHLPPIDWPNLTDEALEELRTLVEAERQRRWLAGRPRAPVDELHDSPRTPEPAHVEVFDTYHCRRHGTRYFSRGELRQETRGETCVYVCTLCNRVADPIPLF
jgi:hypothetical protein